MKSKRWPLVCVLVGLVAPGCSDDEAPPAACALPEAPRFDFTEIALEEDKSNEQCPEIAPSALDTDALSEQGVCEQTIVDCIIRLTCDYEGLTINGRMAEANGGLSGRFDIESPVTCLYAVKAKWKEPDGG